ncbi:glycosyltransferase family 10 [Mucilaginibacter sp. BT774]|uniref:glycosyltransferase family 10 domain-containing protein n=1 Tax=Mucilaginibacter sp. BT774 TaxID=3062276 RepID=UPI0026760C80|nr:glycosyltransferase family 10 [Mucilaginibacter sp. BT774]MDO3627493.1 glycosyltransferase family 10 [Mucilaginibacter sp. BT774]
MKQKIIKLGFRNGLNFTDFKTEVFDIDRLDELYLFEESTEPDFIIFGPYGNDIPPAGDYSRIGYFCENFLPEMSVCDWAFGVPHENTVNHPKYKRIQWHGLEPEKLIKPQEYDAQKIAEGKTLFCNFLYSHPVPYREEFFQQLSRYKKVDAPGKSMNNMPGIDARYSGGIWERKKLFLSSYKFTIAFENYVYPGYQTEKLYDAMQADSLPVYCGDPLIGDIFDTRSFINSADYLNVNDGALVNWLEKHAQPDFTDMRPSFYRAPQHRIKRKLKSIGRELKMRRQFGNLDFSPLIDRIIELDESPEKYTEVLERQWFKNGQPPIGTSLRDRWIEIFNHGKKI